MASERSIEAISQGSGSGQRKTSIVRSFSRPLIPLLPKEDTKPSGGTTAEGKPAETAWDRSYCDLDTTLVLLTERSASLLVLAKKNSRDGIRGNGQDG